MHGREKEKKQILQQAGEENHQRLHRQFFGHDAFSTVADGKTYNRIGEGVYSHEFGIVHVEQKTGNKTQKNRFDLP